MTTLWRKVRQLALATAGLLGRGIAPRLVGAAIAMCGVALLGIGTITSPLSSGHFKLAGTIVSSEGSGCDDNDECGSCETSSHTNSPTSTPVFFDEIAGVPKTLLPLPLILTGGGEDESGGDDCTTTTTSHATSTASSCRTGIEDVAAAVTTCSTSKTSSSKTTSSSASSSSAGSSTSASTSASTHTVTTTTSGALGVSTTTPSTGSDLAFGLGLVLLIGGGGLAGAGYRFGRRRKR